MAIHVMYLTYKSRKKIGLKNVEFITVYMYVIESLS